MSEIDANEGQLVKYRPRGPPPAYSYLGHEYSPTINAAHPVFAQEQGDYFDGGQDATYGHPGGYSQMQPDMGSMHAQLPQEIFEQWEKGYSSSTPD